ncbi:virulence RhuM family protein [Patescibacteria group bacterium]|nr:virulence RhuM family protein [Patescibacteria group bacterium]
MKKEIIEKDIEFLLYKSSEGGVKVDVLIKNETVWLSQKRMAELFDVSISTINEHLKNIFETKELSKKTVIGKFLITAEDNKKYLTNFYNLDVIIAVGYRVNSKQATYFRRWATSVLRDYIIKGFVLDDDLLKNGTRLGKDYFEELLERVRSIRASERRIYLKITDIFAECSIDYDSKSDITKNFFAMVQNKFHYAITGKTAPEIIYSKSDKNKKNMGLETWKNSPKGRILKLDVKIAKNYLVEKEIKKLERTVSSFFDYIENIVENRNILKMEDLAESVDKFLSFNEYRILEGSGKISREKAENKAISEYDEFNKTQKIDSDFEKSIGEIKNKCK